MNQKIICLADARNFYVSVEQAYNSALHNRPVVVLSNGDGNIVAANAEAKALGLTRGLPFFRARALIQRYHVVVHSSNYTLYQDVSDRIFSLLSTYAEIKNGVPQIEKYSIDESFFSVSHIDARQLVEYGQAIRGYILQTTGIPLRLAFGTTKQLAKVAAVLIKAHPEYDEVYSVVGLSTDELDALLAHVSVEELWGIGKKQADRLRSIGITTSEMLRNADPGRIRRLLTVTGARIQLELGGMLCIPLEVVPPPRQGIIYSRGFRRPVETLTELREAVSTYTAKAARKLRSDHGRSSEISVFVMTNPFDRQAPQYSRSVSMRLPFPTSFTPDLVHAAHQLLACCFRDGYQYKRAGVRLTTIISEDILQPDLFGAYDAISEARKARLMATIDDLNGRWEREILFLGAQGMQRDWEQRPRWISAHVTTRWSELIRVT